MEKATSLSSISVFSSYKQKTTKMSIRGKYSKPSLRITDCENCILVGSPVTVETAGQENGGFYDVIDNQSNFNGAWGD